MSDLYDENGDVIWTPETVASYAIEFSFNGWQIRQRNVLANKGAWTVEDAEKKLLLTLDSEWVVTAKLTPERATDRAIISFDRPVEALKAAHRAYKVQRAAELDQSRKTYVNGLGRPRER